MGKKKKKAAPRLRKWISELPGRSIRFAKTPFGKVLLALVLISGVSGAVVFNHFWWKYAKIIDAKLGKGPFNLTSRLMAAPNAVYVGQELDAGEVVSKLRNAGYSESVHNRTGHFTVKADAIEIYPGPLSYFAQEPAVLYFDKGKVSRVVSLKDNNPQIVYELEPELVTNLHDADRAKRRVLRFEDIPKVLVDAIVSIEDHRFFEHNGIDFIRAFKATIDGIVEWRRPRGTSTLSQQLARGFFLTPDPTPKRKLEEIMIAIQLERRLTKQQIFEYYCNEFSLGRRGSFDIRGFGEASQAFFDKDIRELKVEEAALLAGMIQGPSYLNPYRHPERAKARRNIVLQAMLREGVIGEAEFKDAVQQPVKVAIGNIESSDAPYFIDLVNSELQERFHSDELTTQDFSVYTTLDTKLQQAAVDAIREGMEEVDEKISKQRRFKGMEAPKAQAALVAIDPRTGEVKAIVGGRNYGESQLNRVLAKRQPGSTFKPFVYAAALNTALEESASEVFTPISEVDDVPTIFWYDDKPYEPANFGNKILGLISLRTALSQSINIATVRLAELVGYEKVADLARRAGMGAQIQPTPALALGSYEVTPLDVAAAYTVFANGGTRMDPYFVRRVRDSSGQTLFRNEPRPTEVLDPRVAYIVTNMMEDVINRGTAVRVRSMDFREPAAGKTGTDEDGWFAGFTEKLICVVWVGFDDNTDIKLEGAHSALPIWARFMKKAHGFYEYRNPKPFEAVEGTVTVEIDPDTRELATYSCPNRRAEVFIAGTQPNQFCRFHGGEGMRLATSVAGWDSSPAVADEVPMRAAAEPEPGAGTAESLEAAKPSPARPVPAPVAVSTGQKQKPQPQPEKKKGLFGRIVGIFK